MPNIFPVIADDVAVTSPATASYSARGSVDIVTFTSLFRASCLFGAIIAHPFGNHNGTHRKQQGLLTNHFQLRYYNFNKFNPLYFYNRSIYIAGCVYILILMSK